MLPTLGRTMFRLFSQKTLLRSVIVMSPVRNCSQYCIRSHLCGDVSLGLEDKSITLAGWVQTIRLDKFILLRDRSGICQVTVPESNLDLRDKIKSIPNESIMVVEGIVRRRPEGQTNKKLTTGQIEVELTKILDYNSANPNLPVQQSTHVTAKEPLRLQYRYLDLRRPELQKNLAVRSNITMKMREFLNSKNFLDIETPTLFRRTPGGAKEFVVPTRVPNKFYSLVQSPQQFKQLLMVGGVDRYYQVARCYRDEGGKPDRQPEFTQLDIEMSFAGREDIIHLIEDLIAHCLTSEVKLPIERFTYYEAMNKFGTDKPDLRFDNQILNLTDQFRQCGFDVIEKLTESDDDFMVGGVFFDSKDSKCLKNVETEVKNALSSQIEICKQNNRSLIISPFSSHSGANSSLLKKCNDELKNNLVQIVGQKKVGFLVCGPKEATLSLLGRFRNSLARELIPDLNEQSDKFLWVVDFPLFLFEEGHLVSAHHPFTAPHPDDHHMFHSNPIACRSLHYDLVLNGQEIGGGSVRIHSETDQRYVLENVLEEDSKELEHLLTALGSGCPPHAGIALGLDRLLAILTKASSIRDVIAFPKTGEGRDLMSGAPSEIEEHQYNLYHLLKNNTEDSF